MKMNNKLKRWIALAMVFVNVWNLDCSSYTLRSIAASPDVVTEATTENDSQEPGESTTEGNDSETLQEEQQGIAVQQNEVENHVNINGNDATIPEGGFNQIGIAIDYKTAITCSWAEAGDQKVTYMYAPESAMQDGEIEDGAWENLTPDTVLLPGNYYLAYLAGEKFGNYEYQFGFKVTKVNLSAPMDTNWDGTKAVWGAVTTSANDRPLDTDASFTYTVELLKDGETVDAESGLTDTGYDFADKIQASGYGDYTFKVHAVIGTGSDRYNDSQTSTVAQAYVFRDTEKPEISSFESGTSGEDKDQLTATAKDNVGVTAYAFYPSETEPEAGNSAWKSVTDADENEDGSYTLKSGALLASGTYYLYVKDGEGNVTRSEKSILVTRVLCYATMKEDGTIDTEMPSNYLYLFGNSASATLDSASASGYVFSGWYADQTYTGNAVEAVTTGAQENGKTVIPGGRDYAVYAKFEAQKYNLTLKASEEKKEYDGVGHGIMLTAKLEKVDYDTVTYSWYYKASEEAEYTPLGGAGTAGTDPLTNTYQISRVAESGIYKVEAAVSLNGKTYTASAEQTVEITKKPLTLKPEDQTITYGDATPENYPLIVVSGLVDGESYEDLIDAGLITLGTISCTYRPGNAVGTYEILPSETAKTTADNYEVTVKPGTLTVQAKSVESVVLTYKIAKADVSDQDYEGVKSDDTYYYPSVYMAVYTGGQIEPEIAAWDGETQIARDAYTVAYDNNVNASNDAKVTVTFSGNYTGEKSETFTITKQSYETKVCMKDSAEAVYEQTAAWTFGEQAYTPFVTDNKSDGVVTYYYAPAGEADAELNRETASTTMPGDAGTYDVWAVIAGNANYTEVISPAYRFTIKKRPITITAVSYVDGDADTEHNAWTYDGTAHADASYTQEGTFVGTDAFRSVTVTGSITECGEADNVISYELTPTTKADNYEIRTVNGKLTVKALALPAPNGFAWSKTNPGVLTYTPVSRKNLTVEYEIALYREGQAEAICTERTDASSFDMSQYIKEDTKKNGVGAYYAAIRTLPKEVEGTAYANYTGSRAENSEKTYSVKLNIRKDSNTIAGVTNGGNETEALYLLPGESVTLQASYVAGYHEAQWKLAFVASTETSVSDYISYTEDAADTKKLQVKSDVTQAAEINVTVTANDEAPVITVFHGENTANAESVSFTVKATDAIGITGYALLTSDTGKPDTTNITWKTMQQDVDGSYVATEQIRATGTYYAAVQDSAGNVTVIDAGQAITVYSIAFKNGVAADDADLFGGSAMPTLYKVENSTITLPVVSYTKQGYAFKNWLGEKGQIYNDHADYAANVSDVLTAQWSDEKYPYTVQYYYMDLSVDQDGTVTTSYPETPNETKSYTGIYGAEITNRTTSIQIPKDGYSVDETHTESITLGAGEQPVLKVYYKRNTYTITYQYQKPGQTELTTETETYYYGQSFTIKPDISYKGYTFSGWNFGDFDTTHKIMPAKDLTVTGTLSADVVSYQIVYHMQNAPETTGSISGNNYKENPSKNYTLHTQSETSHALQGATVTADTKNAPAMEGFTVKAVTITKGAADGSTCTSEATEATGTADAEQTLYVNYYYDRTIYQVALNVYKDKRDVEANILYTKIWNFAYGKAFTEDELQTLESYGYSETAAKNQWIKDWLATDGTVKSEYASYELADYTDWSTGTKPQTMPAGNVSITKEYVENTSASYRVEFYLQTIDTNKQLSYPDKANYTIYYYDTVGRTVMIDGTDGTEKSQSDIHLNYKELGKMLDSNFDAYTYDTEVAGNQTTMVIKRNEDATGENDNLLRVYFKRNEVETTITYRYKSEGDTSYKNIISYTFKQPWGTAYTFEPAKYYYATGETPKVGDTYTYGKDAAGNDLTGTITKVNSDDAAITTNYNKGLYAISYESRQYIAGSGRSWSPTDQVKTADDLAGKRTLTYQVGQVATDVNNGYSNYIYVNYVQVNELKTYEMDLYYSSSSPQTHLRETTGDTFTVTRKDGSKVETGTSYYIRIANKNDIFGGTYKGTETDGQGLSSKVCKFFFTPLSVA